MSFTRLLSYEPHELRRQIRENGAVEMHLRRGVAVTSLLGIASMAIVSLFQAGVIRQLLSRARRRSISELARHTWRRPSS